MLNLLYFSVGFPFSFVPRSAHQLLTKIFVRDKARMKRSATSVSFVFPWIFTERFRIEDLIVRETSLSEFLLDWTMSKSARPTLIILGRKST